MAIGGATAAGTRIYVRSMEDDAVALSEVMRDIDQFVAVDRSRSDVGRRRGPMQAIPNRCRDIATWYWNCYHS
jgi:hypothetical protein